VPWLLEFVDSVESDPEIFRQLRFRVNPCALVRGGRVYIRELTPLNRGGNGAQHASLRASQLVMRALAAARTLIPHEDLAATLANSAHATEEKVHHFIAELWRQGFLLTDLRPPFTDGDPVRYVLEYLKRLRGGDSYRLRLQSAIEAAGVEPLNAPIPAREVNDAGLPAASSGPPTHIDTVLFPCGELNREVAREAARAGELLLSLTNAPAGPPHLQTYRRSFQDRYGIDREVPLLELVDPEYGIGFPPGYDGKKNTAPGDTPLQSRPRREVLFDLARRANDERRLEMELDEETLLRMRSWTPDGESAPASLEINVFVSAASRRDLDDGRFTVVVGPNVGAMEAGRALGRFAEAIGPTGIQAYSDATQAHQAARPDQHCVELSYLPRNLSLTNILVRPRPRRYEIDIAVQPGVPVEQSLPLHELVVGIRDGRFYVRSPHLDGDLMICSGHMANAQLASSLCRLLSEISCDGIAALRDFDWGMASMLHFLPRIRTDRVVLSLARWRISAEMAKTQLEADQAKSFHRSLSLWRTEWRVPRYVHLADADNRLLLDLKNDMDIEDLRGELKQLSPGQAIMLEELYPDLDSAWLQGASGAFIAEYVVPLVLTRQRRCDESAARPATQVAPEFPAPACRMKMPGSDWMYVKLYCAASLEDDLLVGPIQQLTHWAYQAGIIARWFFVRYADPDPHIRLRFHGSDRELRESLLPKVFSWAQNLVREDLCMRFALDTYEREIERYGGVTSIDDAEKLFAYDSEAILSILRLLGRDCPLRRVEFAVFGLDSLFQTLGCSSSDRLALFQSIAAPREESGAVYRERRATLQALAGSTCDPSVARSIDTIRSAVGTHASDLSEIGRHLRDFEQEGQLVRPLNSVFRSLAHMHCNRLGLDVAKEKLAYGLLTRGYDTLHAVSRQAAKPARASAST
jgi:thiopeptide-type bacteriocin biosynthesis protein